MLIEVLSLKQLYCFPLMKTVAHRCLFGMFHGVLVGHLRCCARGMFIDITLRYNSIGFNLSFVADRLRHFMIWMHLARFSTFDSLSGRLQMS